MKLNTHHRLGFVGKFGAKMSSRVVVRLILMKDGMQVELIPVGPLHQQLTVSATLLGVHIEYG